MQRIVFALICLTLSACQTFQSESSLYEALGEQSGVEAIAERFIKLSIKSPNIGHHFDDTNLDRLFEKFSEQLCEVSGGGCRYTGDDMTSVHKGMNISEREFNQVVELMQQAMNELDIPLSTQNRLLARLAPMREDMLYK